MNNRSAGPRSFNTLQRSNRAARLRRLQETRILLLSICALILLLALTGLVFLFCHIGHSVGGGTSSGGKSGKVVYTQLTKTAVDIHTGNLILINNDYTYQFPEVTIEKLTERSDYDLTQYLAKWDTKPYQVKLRSGLTEMTCMLPEAAGAMDRLLNAFYESTGTRLTFYGGYRSYDYQKSLKNSSVRAGCSDQHTGLSAWLTDGESTQTLAEGNKSRLISLASSFGFIQRYPENKYSDTGVSNYTELFRYVGVPHAAYISAQNLSLESYLKQLRTSYGYSGTHLLLNADGNVVTANAAYEIYYVPMTGDSASIPVPKNYRYTISGDNVGGFIVTVDLNSPVA